MLFFMTFAAGVADRIVSIRASRNRGEGRQPEVVQILMPWWAEELSGSERGNARQNLVQFAEVQ